MKAKSLSEPLYKPFLPSPKARRRDTEPRETFFSKTPGNRMGTENLEGRDRKRNCSPKEGEREAGSRRQDED